MHQFISFSALKSRTSYSKESGEWDDVNECLSSPCLGGDFPVCRKYEEKKFLQLKPSKRLFIDALMSHTIYEKSAQDPTFPQTCFSGSCTNLPGSFECSCEQGWRLGNVKTNNMNIAKHYQNIKHQHQHCLQKRLSNARLNEGKFECEDVNECLVENGGCHHTCVNTPGGVSCRCVRLSSCWSWFLLTTMANTWPGLTFQAALTADQFVSCCHQSYQFGHDHQSHKVLKRSEEPFLLVDTSQH